MKSAPYYFEIKDIITQFVHAFDNVIIRRYNKDREEQSRLKVRYVYSPKQRVVYDLTSKNRHFTLPVIAVNISSVSRDETRVFNKLEGSYYKRFTTTSGDLSSATGDMLRVDHVLQPVPVNIEMNMSILAKYQTDVDQIISNFIPYSDPYIVISWKLPSTMVGVDQEIRSEVMWSGSVNLNYPTEIDSSTNYRVGADTSFTVKGWLFKKPSPDTPVKNIYKINTSYTPTDDLLDLSFTDETERDTILTNISGVPSVTHIDPNVLFKNSEIGITIDGYMFDSVSQVVLSGSQSMFSVPISSYDMSGSSDTSLLTKFPAYSGIKVDYNVISDNQIKLVIPELQDTGNIDIILTNQAGYGVASTSYAHGEFLEVKNN